MDGEKKDDTIFNVSGNGEYFAKAENIIVTENFEFYFVHLIKNGKKATN